MKNGGFNGFALFDEVFGQKWVEDRAGWREVFKDFPRFRGVLREKWGFRGFGG